MIFFPLFTAVSMLGFGIATLRLNPRRFINQILAAICFAGVLYFAAQLAAKFEGARYLRTGSGDPLFWIRVKFGIVGIISPTLVWLCYYSVSGRYAGWKNLARKMAPWLCLSFFLAAFSFTQGFKPNDSLPGREHYGPLYLFYFGPILVAQVSVCVASIVVASKLNGIRKLEFAFITVALGYLTLFAVIAEIVYATWPDPIVSGITRVTSYLVYIVFGVSAWSVTSHRVYHTKQVFRSIGRRLLLLTPIAIVTVLTLSMQQRYEPDMAASLTILVVALLTFGLVDRSLSTKKSFGTEDAALQITRELQSQSTKEIDPAIYLRGLETTLSAFAKTTVKILVRKEDEYRWDGHSIPASAVQIAGIKAEGWYSLVSRGRTGDQGANELRGYLDKLNATTLLFPNWSDSRATIVITLGERETGMPFTYPELEPLVQITNAVDSLYTRYLLALQVRQGAQLAALGTRGVSIVHELRNPMSTIRTFSQLLPERLEDKEFLRIFASTVPPETERIESLAEQLLDLARPRKYTFREEDLRDIIQHTVDLTRNELTKIQIQISTAIEAQNHRALVDRDAITQVLLNLVKNSIQALRTSDSTNQKLIQIRTFNRTSALVIEVTDNGPGFPDWIRRQLFEAFVTGGEKRGLGLGLAISKEIIAVHSGEIYAENFEPHGARITLELPIVGTQ